MKIRFLSTCVAIAGLAISANAALIPQLGDYVVYTSGDFNGSNSDIHSGSLGAGGNVTLTGFGVANGSVVSGGTANFTRGQFKDVYAKDGIVLYEGATINGSKTTGGTSPLDFTTINNQLSGLSNVFSSYHQNITATSAWNGQLSLSGDNDLNVFTIDASELKNIRELCIDLDDDEKILINVTNKLGNSFSFISGFNMVINNSYDEEIRRSLANRILFNFTEATEELTLNGTFSGNLIAMNADVEGQYGNLNGGLFSKSYDGHHQFHINSYDAPPTNVPEPATFSMMLLGILGLFGISRKKNHRKK